jgi:hypothetical protein
MGDFGGGFPQQDHHHRSEVYLPGTTPDLFFIIVLANRPVVHEAVLCRLKRNVTAGLVWSRGRPCDLIRVARHLCRGRKPYHESDATLTPTRALDSTVFSGRECLDLADHTRLP